MHTGTGLAGVAVGGVDDRKLRLLVKAVLCSLALHVLILAWLSLFKEGSPLRTPPIPLIARLVKPVPPPPPQAEPQPPVVQPRPLPSAKAAPKPAQPAPAAAPILAVEPAKQAVESAPSVPAPPAVVAPSVAPPVAAAARSDSPAAPAASTGPDPGSVQRFRLELMDIARRYKRYPRIAQDNNWEGRVVLRIAYAENGSIAALTVQKGTGRLVLDEEAQAMIRSAQARATIPPALRGKAFVLEIPVDFSLEDAR